MLSNEMMIYKEKNTEAITDGKEHRMISHTKQVLFLRSKKII